MPSIATPKSKIRNFADIPHGVYTLLVTGFKPRLSKKKDSVNLNPQLKIVGDGNGNPVQKFRDPKDLSQDVDVNGQIVFSNMSTNAFWILESFVHSCGLEMVETVSNGEPALDIPGQFTGPDDDPSAWIYNGPLLNTKCKAVIKMRQNLDGSGSSPQVDEFLCQLPGGCDKRHATDLAK